MAIAPLAADLDRRKQVRLHLRPDLSIVPQKYEGRTYYVVKDPVNLRYYRLDDKQHFIFEHLTGNYTLDEVQKEFERRFRPDRLTLEDLEGFAQQLVTSGLALNESPQAGKQLFEHRRKRLQREWLQVLTNVLYIKIPVYDPDRLLGRMLPYFRWIFTTWFMVLSGGVMLAAVLLVLTHFETFRERLPAYREFFTVNTFLNMWLALGIVKVIHEFGHGLSCKAFGGEVHEMGALFLVLTPCLYCNVSDAWTMPSKWKRILISFAGIYVELMIAAIATFIWWHTPSQPYLNNLSLCLMVICSVSTVVFNGNPLMRYDGYYVLFDWLEIPNLRDRSNRFLKNVFLEHCLGVEVHPEPYMALGRQVLFVVYAITSFVYRWVVTIAIILFLYNLLKPYKLASLSMLLALAAVASQTSWPLYRMGKSYHQRGRLPDMKPRRVTATLGVLAAVLLAFLLVPLPVSRVRQVALVELRREAVEQVFVPEPAVLEVLYVHDGQQVHENDLLAEFRSLDLDKELVESRSEYEARVVQVRALQQQLADTRDRQERTKIEITIAKTASERDQYAKLVDMAEQRVKRLQLRAPRAGVVMSPPHIDEVGKLWEKEQTTPFCIIGAPGPSHFRAWMPVSTAEYNLLKEDLTRLHALSADVCVRGRAELLWHGRVTALPESEAKEVPFALTAKGGGPLAVVPSSKPNVYVPQSQQYLVPVDLQAVDRAVCPGQLAVVKVHCRWRTGAWWLWRTISSSLDLGLI